MLPTQAALPPVGCAFGVIADGKPIDRGFVLSDHADWSGLLSIIAATEAQRVIVTHGYTLAMVHWLKEQGLQAETFDTEFTGEAE